MLIHKLIATVCNYLYLTIKYLVYIIQIFIVLERRRIEYEIEESYIRLVYVVIFATSLVALLQSFIDH